MSMDISKTRGELIEDFRVVLEEANEEPAMVQYLLNPENLAKMSDNDLMGFIDRYAGYVSEKRKFDSDVADYDKQTRLAVDKTLAEAQGKIDALMSDYVDRASAIINAYLSDLQQIKLDEERKKR